MDIAPTGPPMLSRPEDRAALAEAGPGCLFLTGKAGTGKSTLLREFAASSGLQCAILAPTGLAAIQVGGQTIHSFFRLKPGPLPPGSDEIAGFRPYHPRHRLIRAIDVLVIDEISMVRADLFDAIDTALRRTLRSDLPFAGKRLIVVGDLLQLEPVVSRGAESEMLGDLYPSPFFFDSHVFRDTNLSVLELTEVHRQAGDESFLFALNQLRRCELEALEVFNTRVNGDIDFSKAITLETRNSGVLALNMSRMAEIPERETIYQAQVTGEFGRDTPTDHHLALKTRARVMFVRNGTDWVNGTLGTVIGLEPGAVWVQKDDGETVKVEPVSWERSRYTWDSHRQQLQTEVAGTFIQIPLRLAWALTVHKAQGLTFDAVNLNFSQGAFAHGQLYVALSRCRTLEGLRLVSALKPSDMVVHERVLEFHGQMGLE